MKKIAKIKYYFEKKDKRYFMYILKKYQINNIKELAKVLNYNYSSIYFQINGIRPVSKRFMKALKSLNIDLESWMNKK